MIARETSERAAFDAAGQTKPSACMVANNAMRFARSQGDCGLHMETFNGDTSRANREIMFHVEKSF